MNDLPETLPSSLNARLPNATAAKFRVLEERLCTLVKDGLIVAFSGGVDSAFLLWTATRAGRDQTGARVLALTVESASMAAQEKKDASEFTHKFSIEHRWEQGQEFDNPSYTANDGSRCYHCKTELFRIGGKLATELPGSYRWLAYGYNASDTTDHRPGHQAALENSVLSPLAEAGLTKDDLRILMRAFDIPLAEKPSSPCLSSRIMTGIAVSEDKLRVVESMEALLRAQGIEVARVRVHSDFLRIEVAENKFSEAVKLSGELRDLGLRAGYKWVVLDLAGYKLGGGNLN